MATPGTGLWLPNFVAGHDITFGTNLKACAVLSTWDPDTTLTLGYSAGETGETPSDHEHAATGNYVTGGFALTSVASTITNGRWVLTANNIEWSSITLSDVKHIVVYDPSGTSPQTDPIVAVYTFATTLSNGGGTFTVPWADITDGAPVDNCVAALRNPGVS